MKARRARSEAALARDPTRNVHTAPPQSERNPSTRPPQSFSAADLGTVALVGHRSCGKTSLTELLLQAGRVVREIGAVDDGTTLLDWSPEERRHRQTLQLSTAWIEQGPRILQIIDTPGAAFLAETRDLGIGAAETAVLTVDAAAGVEVGTEEAIRSACRLATPIVAVVTKAERLSASDDDLAELAEALARISQTRVVPLHLPFRDADQRLVGLVDLLDGQVLRFAEDGSGTFSPEPIPESIRQACDDAREAICEAVAVTDDALLEEYLEYLALPMDRVREALVGAIQRRLVIPLLLSSADRRIGARCLLDALSAWVPPCGAVERRLVAADGTESVLDPEGPFVAQVLSEHRDERGDPWRLLRVLSAGRLPKGDCVDGRTGTAHRIRKLYRVRGPRRASAPPLVQGMIVATWDPLPICAGSTLTDGRRCALRVPEPRPPMMALSVRPVHARDEARLREALQSLITSDRGLALLADAATGGLLLGGVEESHLRFAIERLQAWSGGLQLVTELPAVGYVEIPTGSVKGVEGVHVREGSDGLVEEYGKCEVSLAPIDPDHGLRFVDAVGDDEEDLPQRFRGAIEEGARLGMRHGPTAGYPVVGAHLHLTGGAYDMLQSTDDHFRLAGEKAARTAVERVGTRLLEPWHEIEVSAPQAALGDLISDISAHRGRILGMEVDDGVTRLSAQAPQRELRTFASRLQTLTGGRGRFESRPSHYEQLPDHLLTEAIEASTHRRVADRRVASASSAGYDPRGI